jgi:HSP20 family protein
MSAFNNWDPFFPVTSGRRVRGFMPIFDEMDRLTNQLWNDQWALENNDTTDNNLNNNINNNPTDDQKQIQHHSKRHNKKSINKAESKQSESNSNQVTTNNSNTNNNTSITTNNNNNTNNKNMLTSLWQGMDVNKSISLKVDEEQDKFIISANVPNFNKDQLKLQIKDGLLTISGEMREERKDEHSYSKSSQYVQRSMSLPDNINEENISAKYDNGVLKVNIPKLDKPKQNKDTIMIE